MPNGRKDPIDRLDQLSGIKTVALRRNSHLPPTLLTALAADTNQETCLRVARSRMIAPAIREDLLVRNPYNERVNACDTINGRAHGEIARSLPPRNMRLPEVSIATPFGRTGELKSVARSSRVRGLCFWCTTCRLEAGSGIMNSQRSARRSILANS
jgi:hypothetical protein